MRISDWSSDVCSSDLFCKRCCSGAPKPCPDGDVVRAVLHSRSAGRLAWRRYAAAGRKSMLRRSQLSFPRSAQGDKIGRASCRERVCQYVKISVAAEALKKKIKTNSINIQKYKK